MRRKKPRNGVPKPTKADQRLAAAIADAVGPRFELLGSKVDGLGSKIDAVESRLEHIDETLGTHSEKFDEHSRKFDEIHDSLATIHDTLEGHGKKLDQLASAGVGIGRILKLEARVDMLERKIGD